MKLRTDTITEEGCPVEGRIDPSEIDLRGLPYTLAEPLTFSGTATRSEDDIFLRGKLAGSVRSQCSRCLKNVSVPLDLEVDTVFVLREEAEEGEDDDLEADETVSYYDGEVIDLSREVRDLFLVSLPIKPMCRPQCKGLCPRCGADLNENPCRCEQRGGRSPFEALKDLKSKLEKQ
jgi:uncharacterized protein